MTDHDTAMLRSTLSILEQMLDKHDDLMIERNVALRDAKLAADRAARIEASQDKSTKQLLVNATGEVAQLKRQHEQDMVVLAHGRKAYEQSQQEAQAEREMRVKADARVNELERRIDNMTKNAHDDAMTIQALQRTIREMVSWAEEHHAYGISANGIEALKRIAEQGGVAP